MKHNNSSFVKFNFPLLVFLFVILISFTSRLYHLGWSYWYDEIGTLREIKILFEHPFFSIENTGNAGILTRTMPVGYVLNGLAYYLFGVEEFKIRLGVAIAGAMSLILIFLFVKKLYNLMVAMIITGIILIWPWHLFHSQSLRFYSYAYLFSSLSILTLAMAIKENKYQWALMAGLLSGIAIFTHTVCIAIVTVCSLYAIKQLIFIRKDNSKIWWTYLLSISPFILALGGVFIWVLPQGQLSLAKGYTVFHNLKSFVFNLGWSVLLLYSLSYIWFFKKDRTINQNQLDRFWFFLSNGILFILFFGSRIMSAFRPDYLFAMCLPFQLLAARNVQMAVKSIWIRDKLFACGFGLLIVFLPLPSTMSYYLDGNRANYRAAAEYLTKHIKNDDIVVSAGASLLNHYLQYPVVRFSLGQSEIDRLRKGKTCWIVISYGRKGIKPAMDKYLTKNGIRVAHIRQQRLDYHEYTVDIFLIPQLKEEESELAI